MHRHRLGDVSGAGLALFPENHNLLYHCFGEKWASRPSTGIRYPLPWQPWAYGTGDGLGNSVTTATGDS
jgi:hypothetical protein